MDLRQKFLQHKVIIAKIYLKRNRDNRGTKSGSKFTEASFLRKFASEMLQI